jgi:opacity protein-like surface antigen
VLQGLEREQHKPGPQENGMSNKLSLALIGAIAFVAIAGTSHAETLLGKNYIGGSFEIVKFGDDDLDEVLGNGYSFDALANINLNQNIDLNLGIGYLWADGDTEGIEIDLTGIGAGADLVFFFKPGEKVNPYIRAGLMVVKSEVEVSGFGESVSEDDTEVGFGAGVGLELEFTEQVLFRFGLDYFNIDSEDSIDFGIGAGYWFNETVMGTISGSYDFDSENASSSIGLIVKL